MRYSHKISIEADNAADATRELCGYHLTPSSYSHTLDQCDMEHIEALAADMRKRGWVGAPILVTDNGDGQPYIINGRHRSVAACLAGIAIEMYEIAWSEYTAAEDKGLDGDEMYARYINQ